MEINGKKIEDACGECGNILQCELCSAGHGFKGERSRVAEMVACQMERISQKKRQERLRDE